MAYELYLWLLVPIIVAVITGISAYFLVRYIANKHINKRMIQLEEAMQSNGNSIRSLTDTLNKSPHDTGIFRKLDK